MRSAIGYGWRAPEPQPVDSSWLLSDHVGCGRTACRILSQCRSRPAFPQPRLPRLRPVPRRGGSSRETGRGSRGRSHRVLGPWHCSQRPFASQYCGSPAGYGGASAPTLALRSVPSRARHRLDGFPSQSTELRQPVFRTGGASDGPASPSASMDVRKLTGARRLFVFSVAAAAVGGVAWSGHLAALAVSVVFPPLCFAQDRRLGAYAVAAAYYGAASWPLIGVAALFLGPGASTASGVLLWLAATALLAAPCPLLWGASRKSCLWRAPAAVLASCVPPLCIIGWASPLTAAGVLFPGTGWFGIVGVLALAGSLRAHPRTAILAGSILAATTNIVYPGDPAPPPGWEGVDTSFDGLGSDTEDPAAAFQAAEWLQQRALESKAKVIIFPETVVPRWTEATDLFWEQTLAALAASGKTVVIGAGLPILNSTLHENAVLIRGRGGPDSFLQRIPVPIGMWRPFCRAGVPLHLFGAGVIRISGHRAAILICYEQLLTRPVLASAVKARPDVLVAVTNDHYVTSSVVAAVQAVAIKSWARLFAVPTVRAVNA